MSASIDLASAAGGRATLVGVRAQPGARRNGAQGAWNGLLKITVTAPAEDGRANAELAATLAGILGLRKRDVALVRGERSRAKVFRVEARLEVVRARLSGVLR